MYTTVKRAIEKELVPFTALALAVCVLTVLVRYAIVPGWQRNASMRKEVMKYKTLVSRDTEYDELKNAIRGKLKSLEEKHTELTQGLADPQDLSGLLQMIFDKAWDADIRFDKTIPQPEVRGTDYIHYPVLLEMTTSYNSLGKFVTSLERIPQIVRVERVAITVLNDESIYARVLITCFLSLQ